jgi:hypothetical protein
MPRICCGCASEQSLSELLALSTVDLRVGNLDAAKKMVVDLVAGW